MKNLSKLKNDILKNDNIGMQILHVQVDSLAIVNSIKGDSMGCVIGPTWFVQGNSLFSIIHILQGDKSLC